MTAEGVGPDDFPLLQLVEGAMRFQLRTRTSVLRLRGS